jgi:hypothetical protein
MRVFTLPIMGIFYGYPLGMGKLSSLAVSFFADSSFFIFSDIEFVFAFDILYQLLE